MWGQHVGLVVSATVVLGSLPLCLSPVPSWGLNSPAQATLAMCPQPTSLGIPHQEPVSARMCPSAISGSHSLPKPPCRLWWALGVPAQPSHPIQGRVVCWDSPGWDPPAQALGCCWHKLRAERARGAQGKPSMVLQPHPDKGIPKPALGYVFLQAGLRAQFPHAPTAAPNKAHLMTLLNDSVHFLSFKVLNIRACVIHYYYYYYLIKDYLTHFNVSSNYKFKLFPL